MMGIMMPDSENLPETAPVQTNQHLKMRIAQYECEIALLRKRVKDLEGVLFDAMSIRGLLAAAFAPNALFAEREKYNNRVVETENRIAELLRKGKKF